MGDYLAFGSDATLRLLQIFSERLSWPEKFFIGRKVMKPYSEGQGPVPEHLRLRLD